MTIAMKTSCRHLVLSLAFVLPLTVAAHAAPKEEKAARTYTLAELAKEIDVLQKKQLVLKGTVIGACKSGCKMWIADGKYEKGDLFALVRAKDNAFKFDTNAAGKPVQLKGFAVAKLLDFCANSGKEHGNDECATPVEERQDGETAKKQKNGETAKEITFFATEVEYGTP